MIDLPPDEWVEAAWAMRNAAHPTISAARREWFEGVKCLLSDRDLPPSIIHPAPPSNVVRLAPPYDAEAAALAELAGMGWGMR